MYITYPQVYTDLAGIPKKIVGNHSNEVGKYTTVIVNLYSMGYFVVIGVITDPPSKMVRMTNIRKDFLVETSFLGKSVGAELMPD